MEIQVLKDRILVKRIEIENKGLLDIVTDEQAPLNGLAVKVGKLVEDVKEGDKLIYKDSDALPIKYQGQEYFILREYDIIAII